MKRNPYKMTVTAASPTRYYDTLILGAGMSGLACASRLCRHPEYRDKKKSLLVLEGRERIGGRVESVHVAGCRLDTGANWIHGVGTADRPNPLLGILPNKRHRVLSGSVIFRAPSPKEGTDGVVGTSSDTGGWVEVQPVRPLEHQQHQQPPPPPPARREAGEAGETADRVIPPSVAARMQRSLWGLIGSLREAAGRRSGEEAARTTMLRAIGESEALREAYRAVPEEYHASVSAMPQFIEGMEAAPLVAQSAERSSDQPGMSLLEFGLDDFEGDQVFLQDGYTAVVEEVARDVARAGLIRLGVEVRQVDWSKNPIRVETSDGPYTAREVVCTLPLGVLQHHTQQVASTSAAHLFAPPLPRDKQTAIQKLGFGTLDKIFLVYDAPWWTKEPYAAIFKKGLVQQRRRSTPEALETMATDQHAEHARSPDQMIGFTNELAGIAIHADGTTSPGPRDLFVTNLHGLTGSPALAAFVSCANAAQVEAMTDEQAGGIVHRALTSWLGGTGAAPTLPPPTPPPAPKAVHVTRWAADAFSRGSYSHMVTGASETAHREAFGRPVVNVEGAVLRFAGEHTSRNHFATVHGALLSGWREADAILEGL